MSEAGGGGKSGGRSEIDRLIESWNSSERKGAIDLDALTEAHRSMLDAQAGLISRAVHIDACNRADAPTDHGRSERRIHYLRVAIADFKVQARRLVGLMDAFDALSKGDGKKAGGDASPPEGPSRGGNLDG